jgi:hypothetical protein
MMNFARRKSLLLGLHFENRSESLGCVSERLVCNVRISGGRLRLRVPKQLPDDLERSSRRDKMTRIGMAQSNV